METVDAGPKAARPLVPFRLFGVLATVVALSSCTSQVGIPEVPEFVEHVDRPSSEPIFELTVDGVTAEAYSAGTCGVLIVSVPGSGEFAEEMCDPGESGMWGIGGVACAEAKADRCTRQIQPFILGTTLRVASAVCKVTGDPELPGLIIEAHNGWWLIADDTIGGWAYPLDESGQRLDDPWVTEIDDPVAEACGLSRVTQPMP